MTNVAIKRLFKQVAAAYSILDEKKYRFQIIAYEKAAETIESYPTELSDLYKENKLDEVPNIGTTIKSRLEELLKTGKVAYFDEVLAPIPQAVFPLLDVPSFGPKKAYRLVSEFSLANPETVLQDVVTLAKENKIAVLSGFGEKSQADILRAIDEYHRGKTKSARMVLPYATELADIVITYLKKHPDVKEAYTLGSLRRKRETVGDIDIAVASDNPNAVLEYFTQYPYKERVIERGERTSSIIVSSGKQIDLMVESPKGFGALLQHFTGSKAHNVKLREYALSKGLSISDYGIRPKGSTEAYKQIQTEEEFYQALGLQWVPPEMRENTGEIELAIQHALPKLVTLSDIKGDFHLHSSYPLEVSHDAGANTMEEMIEKALSLGYKYLGFSEHNPSQSNHSEKDIYDLLLKRKKYIDKLNIKYKNSIRLFSLLETDILPNGTLAVPDEALALLDATIVSIHSSFSMDKPTMTNRILKGLSHPKAKILAHPSGRLLNQRGGYEVDWNELFTFIAQSHKAIEINASPLRLDLTDVLIREAKKKNIRFFINTDSHATEQMTMMQNGVNVARRGWAMAGDILNTLSYNELYTWFHTGY